MFILYFILVPIIVYFILVSIIVFPINQRIWHFLPVEVCSSPVDVPAIKYGSLARKASVETSWSWLDISSPITRCSEKVSLFFVVSFVFLYYNSILVCSVWHFLVRKAF